MSYSQRRKGTSAALGVRVSRLPPSTPGASRGSSTAAGRAPAPRTRGRRGVLVYAKSEVVDRNRVCNFRLLMGRSSRADNDVGPSRSVGPYPPPRMPLPCRGVPHLIRSHRSPGTDEPGTRKRRARPVHRVSLLRSAGFPRLSGRGSKPCRDELSDPGLGDLIEEPDDEDGRLLNAASPYLRPMIDRTVFPCHWKIRPRDRPRPSGHRPKASHHRTRSKHDGRLFGALLSRF
jgi:hypothetical protein